MTALFASTLVTGCTTDELADGEQAWTFELRLVSSTDPNPPVPTCEFVERAFELRMLYGESGELLAIFSPGPDQRFDTYTLATEDSGVVTIDMTHELPGGATERWQLELYPRSQPDSYVGAAAQTLSTATDAAACRSAYLVKTNVYGR